MFHHRGGKASTTDLTIFLAYGLLEYHVNGSSVAVAVPKELSHREAPFPQHRAEQLGQVQPDVGNVDGHVVRLLQRVCKPEHENKTKNTTLVDSVTQMLLKTLQLLHECRLRDCLIIRPSSVSG